MVQSVGLFILWGFFWPEFSHYDLFLGVAISASIVIGTICLTLALASGQGGPVMAIESCKSLVIVGLNVVSTGILPSYI